MKFLLLLAIVLSLVFCDPAGAKARETGITPSSIHENECEDGEMDCICDDNGWCFIFESRRLLVNSAHASEHIQYYTMPEHRTLHVPIVQQYLSAPHYHMQIVAGSPGY